jgi:putative transcriptional regulator
MVLGEMTEIKERAMKWIAGEIVLSDNPAESLKYWRERFRIPQTELAKVLQVSPSVISDYEAGRRKSPGTGTIKKIVKALISLDEMGGGEVLRSLSHVFGTRLSPDIVLEIREYSQPVRAEAVTKAIQGDVVANRDLLEQRVFGYTVIDSLKAILNLSPEDFRRLYGLTTERVLAFTGVTTGRSPMVAIRVMGITPGMVVLHGGLKDVDPLAVKIAELLKVPLVLSKLKTVEELMRALQKCA